MQGKGFVRHVVVMLKLGVTEIIMFGVGLTNIEIQTCGCVLPVS